MRKGAVAVNLGQVDSTSIQIDDSVHNESIKLDETELDNNELVEIDSS